eukprot:366506-Chlamydomonas_euryale.AAC.7
MRSQARAQQGAQHAPEPARHARRLPPRLKGEGGGVPVPPYASVAAPPHLRCPRRPVAPPAARQRPPCCSLSLSLDAPRRAMTSPADCTRVGWKAARAATAAEQRDQVDRRRVLPADRLKTVPRTMVQCPREAEGAAEGRCGRRQQTADRPCTQVRATMGCVALREM